MLNFCSFSKFIGAMGEAIIGEYTGTRLKMLPSRIEAFGRFKKRFPNGKVLAPARAFGGYGSNPYVGYDSSKYPFLYKGPLPKDMSATARIVVIGEEAWTLDVLKKHRKIEKGDLVITWKPGQNSALDSRSISKGKDVGNVVVQRKTSDGLVDEVHDVTFAFVFKAFKPNGTVYKSWPPKNAGS